jgi:chemotaxis protein methyltransferase CheR
LSGAILHHGSSDLLDEAQSYLELQLTPVEFNYICKRAYRYCGLDIRPGKEGLVQSRLAKQMRQLNIASFKEYCRYLESDSDGHALSSMVDCLTTNHTSFFREEQHFHFLTSTIMREIEDRQQIDIWSAACSTGEEPYSLAFSLLEHFDAQNKIAPNIRILATDISNRALAVARKAVYPAEKLSNISKNIVRKYMLRGSGPSHGLLRVKPAIRQLVDFQRLNLMDSFNGVGQYPLILCRNAMIYFDAETQLKLTLRFHEKLEAGGYFFVGHSESLNRIGQPLKYISPAIYRRSGKLPPAKIGARN